MIAVNGTNPNLDELREEIVRLQSVRQRLSRRLLEAADQLDVPGLPPAAALVDELLTYRRQLQGLADLLGARAEADESGLSLNQLEHLIKARDCRQSAKALVEQLAELKHADIPSFAPLSLCQREASRLHELAEQSNDLEQVTELEALRQHRHPLNSLVRLCDDGEQLSDLDWAKCHDDVVAAYGRQLATALTRGRIRRQTVRCAMITEAAPPEVAAAPVESIKPDPDSDFETACETIFDLTPGPSLGTRMLDERRLPSQSERATSPDRATPASTTNSSELILRLIKDGRLPLALQLARCLELRQRTNEGLPPGWLLRALILGRHLSYCKGEIARQLEEELRQFRPESLSEGTVEHRQAMALLLRAAALPAALLAGSTSAATILRSFKIAPASSQLYNYCSRIAIHGDRLSGRLVEMFHPQKTSATSELNELSLAAQDWLQQTAKNAISYRRNSPLFLHAHWTLTAGTAIRHPEAAGAWCKWQETMSLAWRLLQPVCNQAEGERNWVRQEIARLSTQVRVEVPDQSSRQGTPNSPTARGIVLPCEKMHATLLDAVAIANRWLRLQQAASASSSPLPMEALDLRDEIMQRTDGVLNELNQQRQAASLFVQAAAACCRRTIQHIHAMFEAKLSLPLVEPDPRHVLNAELLRIPNIELNDQWLPEPELHGVECELIASAENPERSWRQGYDDHAQNGNHEATGRLLELDVWSQTERDSLTGLRQSQIEENRVAVKEELQELAAEIVAATNRDAANRDGSPLLRRLERLRQELSRVVNFQAFRRQLIQLHAAVIRQRTALPLGDLSTSDDAAAEPWKQFPAGSNEHVIQSCDIFSGE